MTLFSLLFFLHIPFYMSKILTVSCSWLLFCCRGMRREVWNAAFFSECFPLQLFQLLFLQELEAVSIGEELVVLQGVLSSTTLAQISKQFMLLLSFHLTYSKGLKTDVCHMAQKMLSHPPLVTSGLKISKVITAINHYSISPKERRQLLTITLLSAK